MNSRFRALNYYHNAVRAKEIVSILARHGFDDVLSAIEAPPAWLQKIVGHRQTAELNIWERIRAVCEDLGPTFVKFAQALSTRSDVLPQPLILELKKLRNKVKPVPFDRIKPVLEESLAAPISDVFDEFNPEPIAAGSLGQVHVAHLKKENVQVVVKIQRPNLLKAIESDLDIFLWIARKVHENLSQLKPYDFPSVLKEIRLGLLKELDFRNEARNAELFTSLNPYPGHVFAPRNFTQHTSRTVLVQERIFGYVPDALPASEETKKRLATQGGNSIFHQIVIAGFFHADPHSGNILITEDNRICFIDWGLVGQLTRAMRFCLADLLLAVASQDAEQVVHVAHRMARGNRRVDTWNLEKQVTALLNKHRNLKLSGEAIGSLIIEMVYIFGSNGIQISQDYTLLARSVAAIEEVGMSLDPHFDLQSTARPYLFQLNMERWNPAYLMRQAYWFASSSFTRMQELPGDLQRVLRRFEEEDLNVNLNHKGLKPMEDLLDAAMNRLSLAIIIAALIVGSSMLINTGVEPFIWGYPAIGIIGYLLSALLGLWIVIDILRHGRHK